MTHQYIFEGLAYIGEMQRVTLQNKIKYRWLLCLILSRIWLWLIKCSLHLCSLSANNSSPDLSNPPFISNSMHLSSSLARPPTSPNTISHSSPSIWFNAPSNCLYLSWSVKRRTHSLTKIIKLRWSLIWSNNPEISAPLLCKPFVACQYLVHTCLPACVLTSEKTL